jgi:uncharacterized protein YdbL (DUF1318 family)
MINLLHKFGKSTLMIAMVMLLSLSAAVAMTLEEAKSAGFIGEQRDGYLGLVVDNAPAAVVALVEDVNRQRRERYQQIARENNIAVSDVAQLAYARAVEATRSGHLVQDANGRWVRKP